MKKYSELKAPKNEMPEDEMEMDMMSDLGFEDELEEESMSDLSAISDDELMAEMKSRGLMGDDELESDEASEEDLDLDEEDEELLA